MYILLNDKPRSNSGMTMSTRGSSTMYPHHRTIRVPSSLSTIVVKSVRLVVYAARVCFALLGVMYCSDNYLRVQRPTLSLSLTSLSRSSPKLSGKYQLLQFCTMHNSNDIAATCAPTSRSYSAVSHSSPSPGSTHTSTASQPTSPILRKTKRTSKLSRCCVRSSKLCRPNTHLSTLFLLPIEHLSLLATPARRSSKHSSRKARSLPSSSGRSSSLALASGRTTASPKTLCGVFR